MLMVRVVDIGCAKDSITYCQHTFIYVVCLHIVVCYLHFKNLPLEPISFHLNLLSSACRVHVERKLTSSAVMWARLHCSPLELSLHRLLKEISVNLSPLPWFLSDRSGLPQREAWAMRHLCLLQGSGGPGFSSTRGMTTFSAMSVRSENVG